MVRDLLPETTGAFTSGTNVAVLGGELALEEPGSHLRAKLNDRMISFVRYVTRYRRTYASLLVEGLDNKDELGGTDLSQDLKMAS